MSEKIFVYGSIAFDVIFSVTDDFRKSIPLEAGEIRNFNATYIANKKDENPGGIAGNIAFWLGEAEVTSTVFSVFGKDFTTLGYRRRLEDYGHKIMGEEGEFTSHAYMVSDPLHQQLVIWQPNAAEVIDNIRLGDYVSEESLSGFEWAIFSPGSNVSLPKHIAEFRALNPKAKIILDPGQWTPFWEEEALIQTLGQVDFLIGNDIEFQHFNKYRNYFPEDLYEIETKGERGVEFRYKGGKKNFEALKVDNVVETTGAGDAFRAGFLSVVSQGGEFEEAIEKGCEFGARCVQLPSAQY